MFPALDALMELEVAQHVGADSCECSPHAQRRTPTGEHHIASELLEHTDRANPLFDDSRARVLAAGRPLLAAAQRSNEVRADLTLEQVLDLVIAVATIRGDSSYLEPIRRTALDGVRAEPSSEAGL